jgi:DNA-binding transcriptional ArsR family regulator
MTKTEALYIFILCARKGIEMKRDMELIRKILIALEDSNRTQGVIPLKFDGYSEDQISYHVKILAEEGIITAIDYSNSSGFEWIAKGLTWDGHDYIDAIRDEGSWQKVKEWIKSTGKVLTMETLKQAVKELFF